MTKDLSLLLRTFNLEGQPSMELTEASRTLKCVPEPSPELRTLRLYGALLAMHDNWAHRLVLAAGSAAAASQISQAASIAGAASLVIEADASVIKAAHRQGAFDFTVSTLDEALRTLKNEVRQGRPLAVGLIAEEAGVLAEAKERGLLPDACLLLPETSGNLSQQLAGLGAPLLTLQPGALSERLALWLVARGWHEHELTAAERLAARTAPEPDTVRERWRQQLPLYLRGARSGISWGWR